MDKINISSENANTENMSYIFTKYEALHITPDKYNQKGKFTAPLFWMNMSVAETTCYQSK